MAITVVDNLREDGDPETFGQEVRKVNRAVLGRLATCDPAECVYVFTNKAQTLILVGTTTEVREFDDVSQFVPIKEYGPYSFVAVNGLN